MTDNCKKFTIEWFVVSIEFYILLHLFPAWVFFKEDFFIDTSELFDKGNIVYIIFMITISAFLAFQTKGSYKTEIMISASIYFICHVLLVNRIIYMDLKEDYLNYIVLIILTPIASWAGLWIGNMIRLNKKTAK